MPDIKRTFVNGEEVIEVDMDPKDILHNPILNKGTGFTEEERIDLGIHGLLPYHTSTIDEQVDRRYANFSSKENEIDLHTDCGRCVTEL